MSHFRDCNTQIPDEKQLKGRGFIWAYLSITVGKAGWQEQEAAGHTVFAVRKQSLNAGAQLTFYSLFSGEPTSEGGHVSTYIETPSQTGQQLIT